MTMPVTRLIGVGADIVSAQKKRLSVAFLFWTLTGVLTLVAIFALFVAFGIWIEPETGPAGAALAVAGLALSLCLLAFGLRALRFRMRRRHRTSSRDEVLMAIGSTLAASDKRVLVGAAVVAGYALGSALTSSRSR